MKHDGLQDIAFITIGKESERTRNILETQKNNLEDMLIKASIVNVPEEVNRVPDTLFDEMNVALLNVISCKTTPKMVQELLQRLEEYEIPVIGTQFMEVG